MRGWVVISVLALAGCGEHLGYNPNYQFGANPYGQYRVLREAALVSNGAAPRTIPIALPAEAPSPAQIAGRDPVPVPPTMGLPGTKGVTQGMARPVAGRPDAARPTPIALPVTTGGPYPGSTPVLVRYAQEARHQPGTRLYARSGGTLAAAARLCAGYANPGAAQTAFLAAGGPQRDPGGMDPDGDGFVCGWTPDTLRQAPL